MARRSERPRTATDIYFAHVVPGIEDLAAAELISAGARVEEILTKFDRRDSMIVASARDPHPLINCRLIDDLFVAVVVMATPGARNAPAAIARAVEPGAFERALRVQHAVRRKRRGRSYMVVSRVAGRQTFRRDEMEGAVARAVRALLPHWVSARQPAASLEVWAHAIGRRTLVGLRLSGDEMAQREYKRAHLPGSLKPTVARALVVLSEPRTSDVFVDLMCGAGTILRERADHARARLVVGGDIDPTALNAARLNAGRGPALLRWDAMRLPLRDSSVDCIVTNPPYGRRHETRMPPGRLYRGMLREVARVLQAGARCVVLTGEPDELLRATPTSLEVRSKRRLLLRGLAVVAFVMVRR